MNWNTLLKTEPLLRRNWQEREGIAKLDSLELESEIHFVWQALKVNRDESQPKRQQQGIVRWTCQTWVYYADDCDIIWKNASGCK